jgi:lysozyme
MAQPINVVIDISHHQQSVDFARVKADGIVGVIHKASEGSRFVDKKYKERRQQALDAGLLWGAYHFGVGGEGKIQADHFLETADPIDSTLVVLDYEANRVGPTMTLDQARAFVTHLEEHINRFAGLYSGSLIKEQLGDAPNPDPVLSKCFLWIAQYRGQKPVNIPTTFRTWTLWQYTDGVHGNAPHTVDGIGQCDRDLFNGSLASLKRLWGVTG